VTAASKAAATAPGPEAAASLSEPAASAKAAFEEPKDGTACERVRASPASPPFTIVLRTGKRNGNVRQVQVYRVLRVYDANATSFKSTAGWSAMLTCCCRAGGSQGWST
jgi:hypothetical protein